MLGGVRSCFVHCADQSRAPGGGRLLGDPLPLALRGTSPGGPGEERRPLRLRLWRIHLPRPPEADRGEGQEAPSVFGFVSGWWSEGDGVSFGNARLRVPCFDPEGKAGCWVVSVPALSRQRRAQSRAPGGGRLLGDPLPLALRGTSPGGPGEERSPLRLRLRRIHLPARARGGTRGALRLRLLRIWLLARMLGGGGGLRCVRGVGFAGGFEEAGAGGNEFGVSGCGGLVEIGCGEVGVLGDVLLEGSGAEGVVVGDEGGAVGGDLGDSGRGFAVGVGLHDVGELVEAEAVGLADLDGCECGVEEVVHEVGGEGGKKSGIRDEGLGIGTGRKPPSTDFVGASRGSPGEACGGLDACWCAGVGSGFGFGWRVHALLPSRLVGVRDGAQRGLASGCGCWSRSGGGDGVVGIVNARRGDARGRWGSDGILRTKRVSVVGIFERKGREGYAEAQRIAGMLGGSPRRIYGM